MSDVSRRPNILIVLTDQQRFPTSYEPEGLRQWRRDEFVAERSLRETGVSFTRNYTMATACAPSRASLLTGQYPPLHGVTQTDGLGKSFDSPDMFWLAADTVPTIGDWFRAGGYRTFFKGKWHASHAALEDRSGEGFLLSIDDEGNRIEENIAAYLDADLLDKFGFSEWVGPEPHGLGKHNTGTVKDVFTADETIALLQRFDTDDSEQPWLTVCSFLNPHDSSLFGVLALKQGLRYHPSTVPSIPKPPTQDEDLSTKPRCQQSYADEWKTVAVPQPWIELHRKFHYQMQHAVDHEIARVLDALRSSGDYENTIVVFSSDHGDMLGAHGGMHEKWHNAYEESIHVPFVVAGPLIDGSREIDVPTSHADLIPTLLGLAGIDPDVAREEIARDHTEARPLVGRDLSPVIRHDGEHQAEPVLFMTDEPVLFMTDDEISEGTAGGASPIAKLAKRLRLYSTVVQPNHVETVIAEVDVEGERHLVKLSRYFDNAQFWTIPGEHDERLRRRKTMIVTEPEPDEYELYDLTADPLEQRNLAHPSHATEESRRLQREMLKLLVDQLASKRVVPTTGVVPGYQPPNAA
jgi:arylsulfatase A-like enzyme